MTTPMPVDQRSPPACASILVIEDDESIRETICWTLESEGYAVLAAADGKRGLELLKAAQPPCLVLLDLMLPVMNGWELLAEMHKDPKNMIAAIPVVVTSAVGDLAASSAVKQAQGYIKKPIDLDLLLRVVAKYCGTAGAIKAA